MRWFQVSVILLAMILLGPAAHGQGRSMEMKRPHKRTVTLTITSEPQASVMVGGSYRGKTPVTLKTSPGTKRITLETRDGRREVRTIDAQPGAELTIHHHFEDPAGGSGSTQVGTSSDKTPYLEALGRHDLGVIDVTASVPGRVLVDGNDTLKSTPVHDLEATAGSHQVTVRFVTGGEKEVEVQVEAGKRTRIKVVP